MRLEETTLAKETVFDGRVVRVRVDTVLLPDGSEARREVVEHTGGVCVAAIDTDNQIYLVEQFRYPFNTVLTEIPAGKLEIGEDPQAAALRELREETGLTAGHIEKLGVIYPTTGYCTERLHLYLATGLTQGEQDLDVGEFVNCKAVPFSAALSNVLDNTIPDGKTVATILLAARHLGYLEIGNESKAKPCR